MKKKKKIDNIIVICDYFSPEIPNLDSPTQQLSGLPLIQGQLVAGRCEGCRRCHRRRGRTAPDAATCRWEACRTPAGVQKSVSPFTSVAKHENYLATNVCFVSVGPESDLIVQEFRLILGVVFLAPLVTPVLVALRRALLVRLLPRPCGSNLSAGFGIRRRGRGLWCIFFRNTPHGWRGRRGFADEIGRSGHPDVPCSDQQRGAPVTGQVGFPPGHSHDGCSSPVQRPGGRLGRKDLRWVLVGQNHGLSPG